MKKLCFLCPKIVSVQQEVQPFTLRYVFHLDMWPQSWSKNIFPKKNGLFWSTLDHFLIFLTILRAFGVFVAHNMYTFSETMRTGLSLGLQYVSLSENMWTQEFFHTFWPLNVNQYLEMCRTQGMCFLAKRSFHFTLRGCWEGLHQGNDKID